MKDGDVVRAARRIGALLRRVEDLCDEIRASDHPNAEAIYGELEANEVMVMAWPEHVVSHHLSHPERWEIGDFGIRFKSSPAKTDEREATP